MSPPQTATVVHESPTLNDDGLAAHELRRSAAAAERTVAILKQKVFDLYNGKSSSIQKQLERAREREEKSRRKREVMEARAGELKRYSETLEIEVAKRTEAIKTILDNVTFGFLLVDRDLVVQDECTRSCVALFEAEQVAGRHLAELLGLFGREREAFVLGVDQVFEDILPPEVSLMQMPQTFKTASGRILRAEGRLVRAKTGEVESLLYTISDITALEAAHRESNTNRTLVNILRQKEAFQNFLLESRQLLASARLHLTESGQVVVRRLIHTLKGAAASYALNELVLLVHAIEEEAPITASHLDDVTSWLRDFLRANSRILEIDFDQISEEGFEVTQVQMDRLKSIVARMPQSADLRTWTAQVLQKPAWQLLGPLEDFAKQLAERLGKKITFDVKGTDVLVDVGTMRPVLQALSHLVRNAVDHGIEAPLHRGTKGPRGHVRILLEESPDAWTVLVEDDGRGVDIDGVARRAIHSGLVTAPDLARMSEKERTALIYLDGVSTAEVTTSISGRGVGMSAVKAAVEEAGGSIELRTSPAQGTMITLGIPKPRQIDQDEVRHASADRSITTGSIS